ncbi:helix-turn-helix domain-containing protein [Nocardioides sp. BSK12Z-3]|nr:helix-turn-helix domain-containing protein [Nocardioides bruguierae]
MLRRFRLLDVAAAAHGGEPVDWAGLAADRGFADQSHLVREFTGLTGRSPAAYMRDLGGRAGSSPGGNG